MFLQHLALFNISFLISRSRLVGNICCTKFAPFDILYVLAEPECIFRPNLAICGPRRCALPEFPHLWGFSWTFVHPTFLPSAKGEHVAVQQRLRHWVQGLHVSLLHLHLPLFRLYPFPCWRITHKWTAWPEPAEGVFEVVLFPHQACFLQF